MIFLPNIIGKKLLLVIILIAIFLRLYNLFSVPPSPSLDEVSIGYNAYSILKTGADEYGTKFPILLRAYDDWRPALYVYLVIPFVYFFGLNVLAVRLPSVILSVLTIGATYFLVKELFSLNLKSQISNLKQILNRNDQNSKNYLEFEIWNLKFIALFSAALLAISPWHIYISRLGHEVNAGLAFVVFGLLFFLFSINDIRGRWFLLISAIFIGLSFYTYQSEKIFVPLIVTMLIVLCRKNLWAIKKISLASIVLVSMITMPIANASFSPQGLIRYKATSAFENNSLYRETANRLLLAKKNGNLIEEIYNNRRVTGVRIFLGNYISHFNPSFLFGNSGEERFKASGMGLFYLWELFFILTGTLFLIIKKIDSRIKILFFGWILISLVAPSLTTQSPHAMRSYNLLPIPQILEGLGLFGIYSIIKDQIRIKFVLLLILIVLVSLSVLNFYKQYFFEFPKNQSSSFQYALSQAVPFVLKNESSYDSVIFSNKDNLYQSYMFFLFFSRYDPFLYQKQGGTLSGGFAKNHKFGKFEFRPVLWSKGNKTGKTLYIGNPSDFPDNVSSLHNVFYLNGNLGIKIVETINE